MAPDNFKCVQHKYNMFSYGVLAMVFIIMIVKKFTDMVRIIISWA